MTLSDVALLVSCIALTASVMQFLYEWRVAYWRDKALEESDRANRLAMQRLKKEEE